MVRRVNLLLYGGGAARGAAGGPLVGIDTLWVLVCAFLVVLMQAGFTAVESGMVRAKNSINVALKNLVDFCISVVLFALFGFGLMFGASIGGLVGGDGFVVSAGDPALLVTFFFQAAFCGTATTIVSGAVAERMRFSGYAWTAALLSGLIYPVTGHWAWADGGWLKDIGFHDFAGSTIVHSVGGWVALAALLVIGPRLGRFGARRRRIEGHNLALATLGVFLLWFGWFGFNGGSALAIDDRVPLILLNTLLAGAAGGLAAMAATWWRDGMPGAGDTMNGVLAGLVAVTAGCDLLSPWASLLVGAVGGVVAMGGTHLLERLEIDDAIGAVPVHLMAGVWGTLAVALFAPAGSWEHSRWEQLGIQALGVATIGAYAFLGSFALLALAGRRRLRVAARDERIGLNVSEHGATTSLLDLISQMDVQAHSGDFRRPVQVDDETEASQIAAFYNAVLEKFNLETDRRKMAMHRMSELANVDALTGLANRRMLFEAGRRALLRGGEGDARPLLLYLDLDGFKRVNDMLGHDAGDQLLRAAARRLVGCVRQEDLVGRMGGDEFAILVAPVDDPRAHASALANALLAAITEPFEVDGSPVRVGTSIGIAVFGDHGAETVKSVVRDADHAMYAAKLAGKGCYRFAGDDAAGAAGDLLPA